MSLLQRGDYHGFEAAGRRYLYLSSSAAVLAMDDVSAAALDAVSAGPRSRDDVVADLAARFDREQVTDSLDELLRVRAVAPAALPATTTRPAKVLPLTPVPLSTMVMNVTNQCNLSCTYCYEYSEDRIVDTDYGRQPKWMSEETARESIDFLLRESGRLAHVTFFGGETLLNFPVVKSAVAYAKRRAAELRKDVDFSITTNATLLKPDVIDFLTEHRFGVTISIDGPPELQDKFRVFHSGAGSYNVVAPKIRELIARHRTRPIGARVTLTRDTIDVRRIFDHLTKEMGFWEVGFAPATTSPGRAYAVGNEGFDSLLAQFRDLADEYRDAALENRHHGFSNIHETIDEIHKGASKAWPCGAGMGLVGVSTSGDVALCHRFAGSDNHKIGDVRSGVDRGAQAAFLESHHIADKPDCLACWARPLCAGGCYHEAQTRYGTTNHANLHYCDWIRGWTDTCLRVYGEIAERNPAFLRQFEGPDEAPQPS
jgi:uncharacterized protein